MESNKKFIIVTIIQIIIEFILIFVGWQIISDIIKPVGSNWMWIYELKIFYSFFIIIVLIGNLLQIFLKINFIKVYFFQIISIFIYLYIFIKIRPFRFLFLLIITLLTLFIYLPIVRYFEKK